MIRHLVRQHFFGCIDLHGRSLTAGGLPLRADFEVEDILRECVSMRGVDGGYDFEELSEAAFSIRNLSRKTLYSLFDKHRRYGYTQLDLQARHHPTHTQPQCC